MPGEVCRYCQKPIQKEGEGYVHARESDTQAAVASASSGGGHGVTAPNTPPPATEPVPPKREHPLHRRLG